MSGRRRTPRTARRGASLASAPVAALRAYARLHGVAGRTKKELIARLTAQRGGGWKEEFSEGIQRNAGWLLPLAATAGTAALAAGAHALRSRQPAWRPSPGMLADLEREEMARAYGMAHRGRGAGVRDTLRAAGRKVKENAHWLVPAAALVGTAALGAYGASRPKAPPISAAELEEMAAARRRGDRNRATFAESFADSLFPGPPARRPRVPTNPFDDSDASD